MDTVLLKYHRSGNDYLVYDTCKNRLRLDARAVRTICGRNFGFGSRGVLAGPLEKNGSLEMKLYRPDGQEEPISREEAGVFAQYLQDAGYVRQTPLVLRTKEGTLVVGAARETKEQAEAVGKLFLSENFISKNHMEWEAQ